MCTEVRQDIFQTSSGIGHHYRPGYYFPSSDFKSTLYDPLPSRLLKREDIPHSEPYLTTTGLAHDRKHAGGPPYGSNEPRYQKAPALYKLNYVNDLHEKIQSRGVHRPLTMGYQTSETHDKFRAEPGPTEPLTYVSNPNQGYLLDDHFQNNPSGQLFGNSGNPSATEGRSRGRVFYPKDGGVYDLNEPYLTTNNKYHRAFAPKELNGIGKKDALTYWDCEGYPKAWGHGLKRNPVPRETFPVEPPPMRDQMMFKSATTCRRIPSSMAPVPHSGLRSNYSDHFQRPSDIKMRENFICPVDLPYVLPPPGIRTIHSAPQMYKTEYYNIGSGKPVTI